MTSTRAKKIARAIQQANPGMKYTEALRRAEGGHVAPPLTTPSPEAMAEAALGAPSGLSAAGGDENAHLALPTVLVGHDPSTGQGRYLTFGRDTANVLVLGNSTTGRTWFAENVAEQTLTHPMPWDPQLHGSVVLVDPSGALARRWSGRSGVTVAAGSTSAPELDSADTLATGPAVMIAAVEWVETERQRRAALLAQSRGAHTWLELPEDVKRDERFAPLMVVLDDFEEHAGDGQVARLVEHVARQGRAVGVHLVVLSRQAPRSMFGPALMQNLPVRVLLGEGDESLTRLAFEDAPVPELPSHHADESRGHSRGLGHQAWCARIMAGFGRGVEVVQVSAGAVESMVGGSLRSS